VLINILEILKFQNSMIGNKLQLTDLNLMSFKLL